MFSFFTQLQQPVIFIQQGFEPKLFSFFDISVKLCVEKNGINLPEIIYCIFMFSQLRDYAINFPQEQSSLYEGSKSGLREERIKTFTTTSII